MSVTQFDAVMRLKIETADVQRVRDEIRKEFKEAAQRLKAEADRFNFAVQNGRLLKTELQGMFNESRIVLKELRTLSRVETKQRIADIKLQIKDFTATIRRSQDAGFNLMEAIRFAERITGTTRQELGALIAEAEKVRQDVRIAQLKIGLTAGMAVADVMAMGLSMSGKIQDRIFAVGIRTVTSSISAAIALLATLGPIGLPFVAAVAIMGGIQLAQMIANNERRLETIDIMNRKTLLGADF